MDNAATREEDKPPPPPPAAAPEAPTTAPAPAVSFEEPTTSPAPAVSPEASTTPPPLLTPPPIRKAKLSLLKSLKHVREPDVREPLSREEAIDALVKDEDFSNEHLDRLADSSSDDDDDDDDDEPSFLGDALRFFA